MSALSKYKTYPEYKDSESKWYQEIPTNWDVVPLKYLTVTFVKDGPHETPKFTDIGIPFLSVDGIQNNKLVFDGCRYISNEDHFRYSLKCKPILGDILLGKAASVGKVALVETNIEFNVWSPLAVITPKSTRFSKYIYYALQSENLQIQCDLFSNSNTQKNLGMGTIDNLHFFKPSNQEAEHISKFLDHETAKIDQLIEKQQTLIELLKEKRQAVISHAVTKGLDPNVKMKDSGVEWLGEVPEHWLVTPLKYYANVQGGFAFNSDLFVEDGIQVLRIGNVYQNTLSLERQPVFIKSELSKLFENFIIRKNDILMSLTGTLGKTDYGFAIKVKNNEEFLLNQRVAKITPNYREITTDFMVYILWSDAYLTPLYSLPSGTKQANLSNSDVLSIYIAIPNSLKEQQNIINFLDIQTSKIDLLIQKAEQQIELIKERRTALISAAVTGEIDVRDWQPAQ